MEQEVLHLLEGTTSNQEGTRKSAELTLLHLYNNADFPFALLSVSRHSDIAAYLRQAALLSLNRYVQATWSPKFDEDFKGTVVLTDEGKAGVRAQVLSICTSDSVALTDDRKVKNAASLVASKIASVDFPEAWPELLPTLLQIISGTGPDSQVHGALRVLSELVESGFSEEQFFAVARDLVTGLQTVALNANRKSVVRAMAMSVFRACFDTLEMVMEDHRAAVKGFLDEALKSWIPFFVETIKLVLPEPPVEVDETKEEGLPSQWRGLIALKLQVVKTLEKIRTIFHQVLTPQAIVLFQTTWEDLSRVQLAYHQLFINDERQGRLEDADSLPYTLDFLVLEELDFMAIMLKAPPVKLELETQLKQAPNGPQSASWLQEVMKLVVSCAQITTEEEGLWDIDVNLYLSEETSVTANYTPRTACGDLVVRGLGEWLKQVPLDALLLHCQGVFAEPNSTWKSKEAILFILNQLLRDVDESAKKINTSIANGFQPYIAQCLQDSNQFLRARGHLVLGVMTKVADQESPEAALPYLTNAIVALSSDPSELVQVSCIRVIQDYLQGGLPAAVAKQAQGAIVTVLSEYVTSHDLRELIDSDDLKVTLVETLRDAIMIDALAVLDGPAIDLLFTLASNGASNFQISTLVTETFEGMVSQISTSGHEPYVRLCAKTIPSLTGAFDVANMTHESALTNLAAELVSALAEFGLAPLPEGFVTAVMPKLNRVLLEATDAELVRPATLAVQHMLARDPEQFLAWKDAAGLGAVEVTLTIINRLLNSPDVEDNAAAEVGGLASEIVNKAGSEKLGPYLLQVLQAVAMRLASAEKAPFIQSLIMVFAGLSVSTPKEVIDFLSQVNINGENGLNVVLAKWLENSINFAGYAEIRQNVMALSTLYTLGDPRIQQIGVKGDLIQESTGRIKTRSQARLNPDKWTVIPANLKILKILVEEISSASTNRYADPAAAAAALDSEGSDDDGDEWEDVGASGGGGGGGGGRALDLGLGLTKQQLMAYEENDSPTSSRQRDDETAEYLTNWFRAESQKPGFQEMYNMLSEEERAKLQAIA